jgi:Glycosyltransferases involved in cell wall biogenesis
VAESEEEGVPLHTLLRRVTVVIPAWNEAHRIGETVRAAAELPGVRAVFVVDDGSTDRTAEAARAAGARVVRHPRNRGKGRAMVTGAEEAARSFADQCGTDHQELLLFLDADVGAAARHAEALIRPVRADEVDLAVATFAPGNNGAHAHPPGWPHRLAHAGILRATGEKLREPLIPGQLCLRRSAFLRAQPLLPPGYGAEAAIVIDVLRAGFRVREVPLLVERRAGRRGGLPHRARQVTGVAKALWPRLMQGDH